MSNQTLKKIQELRDSVRRVELGLRHGKVIDAYLRLRTVSEELNYLVQFGQSSEECK